MRVMSRRPLRRRLAPVAGEEPRNGGPYWTNMEDRLWDGSWPVFVISALPRIGIPVTGAMDDSGNPDAFSFNSEHDAVSTVDDLAAVRKSDFWNDPPGLREIGQAIRRIDQAADEERCDVGRIPGDELCDLLNILQRGGRLDHLTHLLSRRFAS